MTIVGDERDGQRRVARMIEEFRAAQSRRLAKVAVVKDGGRLVEFQRDVHAQAAATRSTAAPRTSH
jgi:hypothetical protein